MNLCNIWCIKTLVVKIYPPIHCHTQLKNLTQNMWDYIWSTWIISRLRSLPRRGVHSRPALEPNRAQMQAKANPLQAFQPLPGVCLHWELKGTLRLNAGTGPMQGKPGRAYDCRRGNMTPGHLSDRSGSRATHTVSGDDAWKMRTIFLFLFFFFQKKGQIFLYVLVLATVMGGGAVKWIISN